MKTGMNALKRCLAVALALILVCGNFSGLAHHVSAAGGTTKDYAQLVAENYAALSQAEKNLLLSGLLQADELTYTAPSDGDDLVSVDSDSKTITVKSYKDAQNNLWEIALVEIWNGESAVETVTLGADGKGTYTYGGKAFSVRVKYALKAAVPADTQWALLNAGQHIKGGLENLKTAYSMNANYGVIAEAVPTLVELADGKTYSNGYSATLQFTNVDTRNAIYALQDQITTNGKLNIVSLMEQYDAAASKAQFLIEHGEETFNAMCELYNTLSLIKADELYGGLNLVASIMGDTALITAWNAYKAVSDSILTALEPIAAESAWPVLNNAAVPASVSAVDGARLDTLVAALGESVGVAQSALKDELTVAEQSVQCNMSMYDVNVKLVLKTVQGNVIQLSNEASKKLTLAAGASAADIRAALAASDFEADTLATWSKYAAAHFVRAESDLPSSLNADATYTITYSPKEYTVSYDYAPEGKLPYGYRLTLENHSDAAKAYDYLVNGAKHAQGEIITILGDTTITRTEGKAYRQNNLYAIIADNYANDLLAEILKSGALNDDVLISVRQPDAADAESLVRLEDGNLIAEPQYASSYAGLYWVPYSYGDNGNENLFGGTYTVAWPKNSVKVIYKLVLDNYTAAQVQEILNKAAALKAQAGTIAETLDKLAGKSTEMGQLNSTMLGGLNGAIASSTLNSNADRDAQLKEIFKAAIDTVLASHMSGNQLKLYTMLESYKSEGLIYFYKNADAFIAEVDAMVELFDALTDEEDKVAALQVLLEGVGKPEYIDKIDTLATSMREVQSALSKPNAMIDLDSANLSVLLESLQKAGDVGYSTPGAPYLMSSTLTALDDGVVAVQVKLDIDGTIYTFTSAEHTRGESLSAAEVQELLNKINAKAQEVLGTRYNFYNADGLANVETLASVTLNSKLHTVNVSYAAKQYTVIVEGGVTATIDINNPVINLPAHPDAGWAYKYQVFDRVITVGQEPQNIRLTAEELGSISGTYTVARTAYNKTEADKQAKLDALVAALKAALGNANITLSGENLSVNIGFNNVMDFVQTLVMNGGYQYYGLDGQGLVYLEDGSLKISIQTLIDAIFNDDDFTSDALVALGRNGHGQLLSTGFQLGDSASDLDHNLQLKINISSVPEQMATLLSAMGEMSSYMKFRSDSGVQKITLNLPDKVYGAYLTALIATGHVDLSNVNSIDQQVAFMFMCDYLDAVIGSDADMVTLENTLAMLGKELSIEKYNNYYKMLADSLTYEAAADGLNLKLSFAGAKAVDKLLTFMGAGSSFDTYKAMIVEYESGATIEIPARATLDNVDNSYCALVLDVNAAGATNKFDCIRTGSWTELNNKLSNLAGYAVVVLLDDVVGDLTVSGTTMLDLNGHNVSGNIHSTGNVFVLDSSMDTYGAGTVNGVSGSITVIAGNYNTDVSAYLRNGYYMDGKTVRNAMYYIECDADGNVCFVVNSDVYKSESVSGYIPNVKTMALDMAFDLAFNYATTAGLKINGNTVYDVQFNDLLALLQSKTKKDDVANMVIGSVDMVGTSGVANDIIADLLNFERLYQALKNGTTLADYDVTVAPWQVAVERTSEDYLTLSILANHALQKNFGLSIKVEGDSAAYVMNLAKELAQIVDDETNVNVDIKQPTYTDGIVGINGNASANLSANMSVNPDYAKALSIILAYGNSSKASAVAAALAADDMDALKTVVDNTSVAELFAALKALSTGVDLNAMASAIGVDASVDLTSVAALEKVYHLSLVAAGKVLEQLAITGTASTFGGLYQSANGYYVLSKSDIFRDGELSAAGITAQYNLGIKDIGLKLKLFGAVAHEHDYTPSVTAPTCTEQGYTTYTCACGDSYKANYLPATGHLNTVTVNAKAPTCTEAGYTGDIYCNDCNSTVASGSPIAATGHLNTVTVNAKAPTCTGAGYTGDIYCNDCNSTVASGSPIAATGHLNTVTVNAKAPTCTEAGYTGDTYCNDCKSIVATGSKINKIPHNYAAVVTAPTCTEKGYTTYTCACGASYVSNYVPANGHSYTVSTIAPTCTENGYDLHVCDDCEMMYRDNIALATGHVDENEDNICDVCDEPIGEQCAHEYELVDSKDATCTENGYRKYACKHCGDSYTVDEEATGHNYVADVTAPTCSAQGYTTYTCACGDTYKADYTDMVAHNWEDATCTTAKTCSVCGETEGEALGHSWEDATCTTAKTCSVCGETEGEALGHSWEDATCTTAKTCSVCGETEGEALGHGETEIKDAKAATCTEAGYTGDTYCKACGEKIADGEVIAATGHGETEIKNAKAATCTEAGYTGDTYCKACGEKIADGEVIAATGHGETEVKDAKAATCTEDGYTGDTYCKACGEKIADGETIAATGHNWDEGTVTREPTVDAEGEKTFTCDKCDETKTEAIEKLEPENGSSLVWIILVIVLVIAAAIVIFFVLNKRKTR